MELNEFAAEVRTRTIAMNAADKVEIARLNAELSEFIADNIRDIMERGLNPQEIQNALRAALDDFVPQTYAPDSDEPGGEKITPPIDETTYFVPLDEVAVAAFFSGELDGAALTKQIGMASGVAVLDEVTGLELVLTGFGRTPEFGEAISGGEIVCGADGEAFMPEYLTVTDADGGGYHVCEPMVFKSAAETKKLAALLMSVDEKAFRKKADIKKLIKSGWLEGYDKRLIKREAENIANELLAQFAMLRTAYLTAAGQGKGLAIFVGYAGADI